MTDVPIIILAGQSNVEFAGIDNRIVERLTARGGAFEFVHRGLGGTSLFANSNQDWDPTSTGELFSQLVTQILAAAANVRSQGHNPVFTILWVQGETDRFQSTAAYAAQLTLFITALRTAIAAPTAEFYISTLSFDGPVRTAQFQVAGTMPGVHAIDTAGATFWEPFHYDHATRERIADQFINAADPSLPTIPGYTNLLTPLTQGQNGAYYEVFAPVYLDFTYTSDDRHHRIFGGNGDDTITTGAGNDIVYGGGNDDLIRTGAGNDYIDLGHHEDVGYAGEGNDTVRGRSGADVIHGEAGNDTLYGDEQDDQLFGGADDDSLDGGTGTDRLYGGTGNDTFYADVASDLIFEGVSEGTDTVIASAGFYLYANIENLTLAAGSGDFFGVGNELANVITGNAGGNLLIAGGGIDTVNGGLGNDAIYGQDGADVLNGEAGIDYIVGGIGHDVIDGGADADNLFGEDGNDTLIGGTGFVTDIMTGGAGNDILRGDSGLGDYDLMDGGADNDSYYVDTGDDLTFEAIGGGTDTVYADVRVTNGGVYLYANVENLVLIGTTAFGVGNELDNLLTGNASGNYLLGGAGADTINGGAGNDVLFGEGGNDAFAFSVGSGGDVIGDFQLANDRMDVSAFFTSFAQAQANFSQVGNDGAINLGNGDFIVLHGVTMANLTAGHFIFGGAGAPAEPEGKDGEAQVLPGAVEATGGKDAGPQILPGTVDSGFLLDGKADAELGPQVLPGAQHDDGTDFLFDLGSDRVDAGHDQPGLEHRMAMLFIETSEHAPGLDHGIDNGRSGLHHNPDPWAG